MELIPFDRMESYKFWCTQLFQSLAGKGKLVPSAHEGGINSPSTRRSMELDLSFGVLGVYRSPVRLSLSAESVCHLAVFVLHNKSTNNTLCHG
jgi:hypothetical protein